MFGEGSHIRRGIRGDDGFATRGHTPTNGFPHGYALSSHGSESSRSSTDAYEFSPFQHAEASLSLED
jgi:hypothetical protein